MSILKYESLPAALKAVESKLNGRLTDVTRGRKFQTVEQALALFEIRKHLKDAIAEQKPAVKKPVAKATDK